MYKVWSAFRKTTENCSRWVFTLVVFKPCVRRRPWIQLEQKPGDRASRTLAQPPSKTVAFCQGACPRTKSPPARPLSKVSSPLRPTQQHDTRSITTADPLIQSTTVQISHHGAQPADVRSTSQLPPNMTSCANSCAVPTSLSFWRLCRSRKRFPSTTQMFLTEFARSTSCPTSSSLVSTSTSRRRSTRRMVRPYRGSYTLRTFPQLSR